MSEIKLTDYLPDVDEISAETLQEVSSVVQQHKYTKLINNLNP